MRVDRREALEVEFARFLSGADAATFLVTNGEKVAKARFVVPNSTTPVTVRVPFDVFVPLGGADLDQVLSSVDGIQLALSVHSPGVDFEITSFRIVPEPSGLLLLLIASLSLLAAKPHRAPSLPS